MRNIVSWINWAPLATLGFGLSLGLSSCQHSSLATALHPHVVDEPIPSHYCPFPSGGCSVCSKVDVPELPKPLHETSTMASTTVEAQESDILGSLDEASAVQTSAAMAATQDLEANPEAPMSVQEEPVWNRIMGREKMVVGVKADAPPFGVLRDDGQFWGFEVDLAMALGQHMGVEVELVPVSAKQRAPYILQDKVDLVMATMTMTQKREQVVDFSIPYFEVGQGLITHADATIGSFKDLKGKKVAVLEGTQAFHTLRRIQPDCYLVIVDSYGNGIDQVLNKEVDAICSDHLLLMGLLHDHPGMALLTLVEETFAPDPYAIAMRENESTLRDTVNEALMQFWEEGIWQDTYETWFGMGSMYNHDLVFRINMLPK